MEQFLFTAGGFGHGGSQRSDDKSALPLRPWQPGHAIRLTRKSPRWRRLQIGSKIRPNDALNEIVFDAVVRCDDATADIVEQVVREWVAEAQAVPEPDRAAPPEAHRDA